jgi:hypothetical protein
VPYFEAVPEHLGATKTKIDAEWTDWIGRPEPRYTAHFASLRD